VNLSRMAGFQFPSSLVIRAKSASQGEYTYLIGDQLLLDWEGLRFGENHLDCYFLNEHEYYYAMLEANEGLLQSKSTTDLPEILSFSANRKDAINETLKTG
jgi:hypothetical protein